MSPYSPVKTKVFIKFLKHQGCYMVKKQTGSHQYWKKPGLTRRITIRPKDKDIPALHVKTNLETLSLDYNDLLKFMNK